MPLSIISLIFITGGKYLQLKQYVGCNVAFLRNIGIQNIILNLFLVTYLSTWHTAQIILFSRHTFVISSHSFSSIDIGFSRSMWYPYDKYWVFCSFFNHEKYQNFMCPVKHMWIKWLTSFAKAQAGSLCILSWVVIITQSDNLPFFWPE